MNVYSNFIEAKRFEKKFEELKDIDFSFFFDYRPNDVELAQSQLNIFCHEEPNEYFHNGDWILQNWQKFSLVLTLEDRILKRCENAELMIFGESWLDDGTDRITKQRDKKFEISHLCGKKLIAPGHVIRHSIFARQDEIQMPKKFEYTIGTMNTFQDNIAGKDIMLGDSMFSLAIENTQHHNYFTEKIVDCVLMKTVPIYWGCSNIDKFFNTKGLFLFRSDDEAIDIINSLTPDTYNQMLPYIEENYKRAFDYKNYMSRIKDKLVEVFKLNGIM